MNVTDYKFPQTVGQGDNNGNAWTDADEVKIADASYASVVAKSNYLKCTNFGFLITDVPAASIITGLETSILCYGNGVCDEKLYVCINDMPIGTNMAHSSEFEDAIGKVEERIHGGAGNVYGVNLSPPDVLLEGFGFYLSVQVHNSAGGSTAYVDSLKTRIYYTDQTEDVTIANLALSRIGENAIVTFADNTPRATVANLWFNQTRRTLLTSHRWMFARVISELEPANFTPVSTWSCAYKLPSNFLRMEEYAYSYEIIGNYMCCNEEECKILYIGDITDATKYSPNFINALYMSLALNMTTQLVDRGTQYDRIAAELKQTILSAYKSNEVTGKKNIETFWSI